MSPTELSITLVPWLYPLTLMSDLTDWLLHTSLWGSWCLNVLECERKDPICLFPGCWHGGGRVVGGFLLTDSESALEI